MRGDEEAEARGARGYVKKKAAEREAIQKQIAELSEKRDEYIKEQQKKNPSQGRQGVRRRRARRPARAGQRRRGSRFRSKHRSSARLAA